jgi:hypothetical protein
MEYWSIGTGGVCGLKRYFSRRLLLLLPVSVFSRVDRIRFVDDQRFSPRAGVPFVFQRFNQARKAVGLNRREVSTSNAIVSCQTRSR